jgi:hypothetical protein
MRIGDQRDASAGPDTPCGSGPLAATQGDAMIEDLRRGGHRRRLGEAHATPLEDASAAAPSAAPPPPSPESLSRRGRRSHSRLSFDANQLRIWLQGMVSPLAK